MYLHLHLINLLKLLQSLCNKQDFKNLNEKNLRIENTIAILIDATNFFLK
jgi:hypothetical protein